MTLYAASSLLAAGVINGTTDKQSGNMRLAENTHALFTSLDIAQDKIWSDTRTVITRGSARSVAINGVQTNSKLTKIIIKKHSTRLPKDTSELKRASL